MSADVEGSCAGFFADAPLPGLEEDGVVAGPLLASPEPAAAASCCWLFFLRVIFSVYCSERGNIAPYRSDWLIEDPRSWTKIVTLGIAKHWSARGGFYLVSTSLLSYCGGL